MKPYAIGIDVGGTKIAAGVLDRSMNVLSVHVTKEHAGQLPARVVDAIEWAYWQTLKQAQVSPGDVAGIGLSFAGHTDGRRGVVLTSSNMPEWDQVPLRDIVAKRLGQPVLLDNDTNLAVVAEHRWGAAQRAAPEHFLFPAGACWPDDPTQPSKRFKTAWTNLRKKAKVRCRIHDLRHTAITKLAESGASDSTIMALAGHLSRAMLEKYSHIRMNAKRQAVESMSLKPKVQPTPQSFPQSQETAPVLPSVKPS